MSFKRKAKRKDVKSEKNKKSVVCIEDRRQIARFGDFQNAGEAHRFHQTPNLLYVG